MVTFVVEPINSIDARTLMVSPEQEKVLWVLDFISHEQANAFDGLLSPIDVIP